MGYYGEDPWWSLLLDECMCQNFLTLYNTAIVTAISCGLGFLKYIKLTYNHTAVKLVCKRPSVPSNKTS